MLSNSCVKLSTPDLRQELMCVKKLFARSLVHKHDSARRSAEGKFLHGPPLLQKNAKKSEILRFIKIVSSN